MRREPLEGTTRTHRALADPNRVRILRALGNASRDVPELAARVRLHPNTVRSHLGVLAAAGLVRKRPQERLAPGRPRLVYEAVAGAAPSDENYRLLAEILAGYLRSLAPRPAEAAEEAGSAWGRHLADRPAPFAGVSAEDALAAVARVLTEIGFDPKVSSDETGPILLLRHCPFLGVAETNPDVVCSVHRGLIAGLLAEMGAPLEAIGLEPFAGPSLCVAHLGERSPEAGEDARP